VLPQLQLLHQIHQCCVWRSPWYCQVIAVLLMLMPLCFSSAMKSLVAERALARAFTSPASWMAPPYSSSFSVCGGCSQHTNKLHDSSWHQSNAALKVTHSLRMTLPYSSSFSVCNEAASTPTSCTFQPWHQSNAALKVTHSS
jgi:hypothetical protein